MALTYTPPGALGQRLPSFNLKTVTGETVSSSSLRGAKAVVVMFICNHCPYVKAIEERLIALAHSFRGRGVDFVGICSNDPTDYPEDAPAALLQRWKDKNYGFPYLIDSEQTVARDFGAVCTPDIFVFDNEQILKYRGRLDDSWRHPQSVQKQELRDAIEAILQGRPAPLQNPSMGCSIKWKSGDSP